MKKIISIGALLFLALAVLFLAHRQNHSSDVSQPAALPASPTPLASKPRATIAKPIEVPAQVNPAIVEYLQREALRMDSPSVDQAQTAQEIQAQADLMQPKDLDFIQKIALSDSATANEKIMAVFLLSKAKGSEKNLADFVIAPLKHRPNPPIHSVEETAAMQEKSQRMMAIQELLERARTNSAARAELARAASEVQDSDLRAYIVKKMRELPPI